MTNLIKRNVVLLEWIATILSIVGSLLCTQRLKECYIVYSISNILWILVGCPRKMYGLIVVQIVFLIIGIYGYIQWSK